MDNIPIVVAYIAHSLSDVQKMQHILANEAHIELHVLQTLEQIKYTTCPPDVILFDVAIWQETMCSEPLKQIISSTPVIIVTTEQHESDALLWVQKGASCYLIKEHLHRSEVVRTIQFVIERTQLHYNLTYFTNYIETCDARFYSIIENSGDGILVVNGDGVILFVNTAATTMLCRTEDELVGMTWGFPLVAGKTVEVDVLCKNGSLAVAEMLVEEINWDGNIAFLSTLRDVTKRKQYEVALSESEQRYKLLLGAVTDYIYTVDVEHGRVVHTTHNINCEAVTGYELQHYERDPSLWYTMIYEEDRAAVLARAEQLVCGINVLPLEHRIWHKNGTIRWVKNTYVLRHDSNGHFIGYDGLIADITERKAAEEQVNILNEQLEQRVIERTTQLMAANDELQREIHERNRVEEELRKLTRAVEQSPATIVITDLHGNIEYINPKFCHTTGYTYQEALGQNPRILKSGNLDPTVYETLWATISSGNEWRGEFYNKRKDGSLYWEYASISPIVNSEGTITHFLAVKEDITTRKQAEAELQQAREVAETATHAKSNFLASMSHEIRTPLNAIIGMTTLLNNMPLPDEQRDYVETIRICSDSLLDIINDILDFSKIEAGKIELEQHPFDVCECIEQSIDVISSKAIEKQLTILYVIRNVQFLQVIGDSTRIRQILVNLLSNAVKFTERGDIIVTVESLCQITEETPCDGSTPSPSILHLSVRDTGIGIAPEHMPYLFRSFSQVDTSITRRYGGTGLGLAISKSLAEMMNGSMWVESDYGVGSTFHVTIAVTINHELYHTTETATNPAPSIRLVPELQHKHVLIVAERPTICDIIAHHCTDWGMQPHTIATTTELNGAHSNLLCEMFDIAIIDTLDTHSIAIVQDIRSNPMCHIFPIILVGNINHRSLLAKTSMSNLFFLARPIKFSRLRLLVQRVITGEQYDSIVSHQTMDVNEPLNKVSMHHPLRLLVAEDNIFNQKVITLLLERLGYCPDVVMTGREVLTALDKQFYDVILMDVQMPDLDGLEATRIIRTRWLETRQPWIIAMTAHALSGDRQQCIDAGMDDYISKPVRLEELVRALTVNIKTVVISNDDSHNV